MIPGKKRENFDVTPEQAADIDALKEILDATSRKDALLRAARIVLVLAQETRKGNSLFIGKAQRCGHLRFPIPELEKNITSPWKYLIERAHPWRRQLYVKGRNLLAATVWTEMIVNKITPAQAVENWKLPLEAIEEIFSYCEENRDLIKLEAEETRRRLREEGVHIEPAIAG